MKHLFVLIVVTSFLVNPIFSKSGLQIKGLSNINPEQSVIYLYQNYGPKAFLKDSAAVKKGKFSFKFSEPLAHGVYKIGYNEKDALPMLVESTDLLVNISDSAFVDNSPENIDYNRYLTQNTSYQNQLKALEAKFKQIVPLQKTNPEAFKNEFEKIRATLVAMNIQQDKVYREIDSTTNSTLLKKMVNLVIVENDLPKSLFFTTNDFDTETFVHSDIYERKTQIFFMRYGNLNAQTVQTETQAILALSKKSTQARDVLYFTLCTIALSTNIDYARVLVKEYQKEYPQSPLVPEIIKIMPKAPLAVGDKAPELAYPNPDGEIMKLSSLKGKVVLIDFWASWCGPCRRESPNVVRAYHKYRDNGFTVFSVSLDADKESWKQAIEQDGLSWPYHVSDLKRWRSEASKAYQVRGIPATFLVDENGIIIGKNLRGEALIKKLDELFK